MRSLSDPAPPRCQGCIDLEKRITAMERAFALMSDFRSRPPARTSARQKAAEAWGVEAS